MYNIRHIRKYPTSEATQSLVHAIFLWVAPDYRNNLIFNTPATHIAKHQRIQNYATRLAYKLLPYFLGLCGGRTSRDLVA